MGELCVQEESETVRMNKQVCFKPENYFNQRGVSLKPHKVHTYQYFPVWNASDVSEGPSAPIARMKHI